MDLLLFPLMAAAIFLPSPLFVRRHPLLESVAMGAATGVLAMGAIGLVRFLLMLPAGSARTVGLAAFTVSTAIGVGLLIAVRTDTADRPPAASAPRHLWVAIAGAALLALGVEAALPHYDLAARYYDWFMHYDIARVYEHATGLFRTWLDASLPTRGPLYNLLGAVTLTLFGDRFQVFQVLTAALAWLWILPFALLARRWERRPSAVIVALGGLSPLVLHTHTYAWSKGLVTFFALYALERYLALAEADRPARRSIAVQLGVFSAATVMAHPGFVGFPLVLFALLGYQVVRRRCRWLDLGLAGAGGLAIALPWCAWAFAQYGFVHAFLSYTHTPYASLFRWAFDRLVIVITSFLPVTLPPERYLTAPGQAASFIYLGTAAGIFGVAFVLRTLAQHVRRPTRIGLSGAQGAALLFALGGFLIADLLHEEPVSNDGGTLGIPTFLVLALLAVSANPLTARALLVAVMECLLVNAAVSWWVFSPASRGLYNQQLAAHEHIHFLGQDTWPVGLALAAVGAALLLGALWPGLRELLARPASRPERAAA